MKTWIKTPSIILFVLLVGLLIAAPRITRALDEHSSRPPAAPPLTNSIGTAMVRVPAGRFLMGSPSSEPGRDDNETQFAVTISRDFLLGATELTQGQWKRIMGNNPSHFNACGADCPVDSVTWNQAADFCNRLSAAENLTPCFREGPCRGGIGAEVQMRGGLTIVVRVMPNSPAERAGIRSGEVITAVNGFGVQGRDLGFVVSLLSGETGSKVTVSVISSSSDEARTLVLVRECVERVFLPVAQCTGYRFPTEAEWEYAARAGGATAFADGPIASANAECEADAHLDPMAWYCNNSDDQTHPVAKKQPNAWGLYDMHGNVWELTGDLFGAYPTGSVVDPHGANEGTIRVYRGGGYDSGAVYCRSALRRGYSPNTRSAALGFRLARSAP